MSLILLILTQIKLAYELSLLFKILTDFVHSNEKDDDTITNSKVVILYFGIVKIVLNNHDVI